MPEGPMPPMGGAPEPPMPEDGPEPPMDDESDMPKGDKGEGENEEINNIFDKLDTEKQAAVIKYAKSMVSDEPEDDEEPPMDDEPDMPMESRAYIGKLVNEIVNNILNDDEEESEERPDTTIRNKKVTKDNPFISKR